MSVTGSATAKIVPRRRKMALYHLTLIVLEILDWGRANSILLMTVMTKLFGLLYQAKSFKDCSLPESDFEVK